MTLAGIKAGGIAIAGTGVNLCSSRNLILNPGTSNVKADLPNRKGISLVVICCLALCACHGRRVAHGAYIEFTKVPLADEGGPEKLDLIEGRVAGARPGQQVVLFAQSGVWYVQPFADQPFTQIQPDSTWKSATHLGNQYAALLVDPGYQPPSSTGELPGPGSGVIAVVAMKGQPVFWRRWWFVTLCALAFTSVLLAFYSYRLQARSRQMNVRFEGRLAERVQVAQELHDTLLQGVISASMQLHVAVDRVPEDLPAKSSLNHVQDVMGQVIEEGRSALKRLRSSAGNDSSDLEQAFHRIQSEFTGQPKFSFRVTVEGPRRPVHPIIRDEIYRIGREAVGNALQRAGAKRIEVEIGYGLRALRIIIRDDGRDDGREFSPMSARAKAVGARLKARSRGATGTEVELMAPANIAFQDQPSGGWLRWLAR